LPDPATPWERGLTYDELTAAIDRAFAGPAADPLPVAALFAELEAASRPMPLPLAADAAARAAPEPAESDAIFGPQLPPAANLIRTEGTKVGLSSL
jgi:hypothetical protein